MKKLIVPFFITIFIASCPHLLPQAANGVKYENVMAVYIFNFTKFLEWKNDNPECFYIWVLGKSKITEPLIKIAEKENVNGKKLIIEEIKDVDKVKKCGVLFISNEDESILPSILKKTMEKNILTVSNTKGFANKGVCINFVLSDDKMRFEINRKAVEESGIIPSTRLLSLALKVYE